jgi:hypothetical protein
MKILLPVLSLLLASSAYSATLRIVAANGAVDDQPILSYVYDSWDGNFTIVAKSRRKCVIPPALLKVDPVAFGESLVRAGSVARVTCALGETGATEQVTIRNSIQ